MSAAPAIPRETHNLTEACQRLGISKTLGYDLAARGEFPCRVLRFGRRLVVPRVEVDRLLGVATTSAQAGGER